MAWSRLKLQVLLKKLFHLRPPGISSIQDTLCGNINKSTTAPGTYAAFVDRSQKGGEGGGSGFDPGAGGRPGRRAMLGGP